MLYQAKRIEFHQSFLTRAWAGIAAAAAVLRGRHDDRVFLDGLNARALEDIGLRRTATRSYAPLDP